MLDARSVEMQDAETGAVIRQYPSVYSATMDLYGKTGTLMTAIVNCCKGRQKTAYGFKWAYSEGE